VTSSASLAEVRVGILALQGAVGLHADLVQRLGAQAFDVRTPADLDGVDALILPGGESTTMSNLLARNRLFDPIAERLAERMPVFGTCAGMILLAATVLDGRADQRSFAVIDIAVRRNAFGRQVDSFETDLHVSGHDDRGEPIHAVFIRAPFIESVGAGVEVLATVAGHPVCARQGPVLVTAFHPELSGDPRLHRSFLAMITAERS
jgi:5'-phosphate synthase pdxT subunit